MQTITLVETLEAIRKHTEAGTLGALAGEVMCKYDYENGNRCAIGTVLTDETLAAIKAASANGQTVTVCESNGLFGFAPAGTGASDFAGLQGKHDDWAMATDELNREFLKSRFYTFVNELCIKVGLPTMG